MLFVVGELFGTAALGFVEGGLHALGDCVGVEDHAAVGVPGGTADGLDQRRGRAQIAFFVRIEDRHQSALGNIEALAQQVDPDQHVVDPQAQIADDLDPLERVDVGVDVADLEPRFVEIVGQVFGHPLGQGGDQHAIAGGHGLLALGDQVVDLVVRWPDQTRRIEQAGRADDLLGEDTAGALELPGVGRGGDVDRLRAHGVPLFEFERAVVLTRRQAEAVVAERDLARAVALEHRADLGDRHVAFVDDEQGVFGQVFEQGRGRLAGRAAGQVAAVVLDPGADTGRLHHLQIESAALLQALGFEQLALALQLLEPQAEVVLDVLDRLHDRRLGGDVVGVGVEAGLLQLGRLLPGQGVDFPDALDFVAEERQAPGAVLEVGREDLDGIAPDAEGAALEADVVAPVLQLDEAAQHLLLRDLRADFEQQGHGGVGLRRSHAVDAGNRGDDDDVAALEQGPGRRVAHAVDLLVDGGFLVDVGV